MNVRRYLTWSGIAVLWLAFIALTWVMSHEGVSRQVDFRTYYDAAARLLAGEPLYQGVDSVNYVYPPLVAQFFIPFVARFSLPQLWDAWIIANLIFLIATVAMLSRHIRPPALVWALTPLFMPLVEAFYVGQVTILLLALLAGAWWAVKHERRAVAGLLLALVTWIKVFPLLLIAYFLWKRDWRVVEAALVGGIALGALQIAISGVTPLIDMTRTLLALNQAGQPWALARNASVFGFSSQWFGSQAEVTPVIASAALLWLSRGLITLVLIAGAVYATLRSHDFDAEFALVLLTSMLVSPTLFPASMPPLMLVFCLLLKRRSSALRWFVTAAIALLAIYWLYVVGYTGNPPASGLLMSFGFYTLAATWGVNAGLLGRAKISRPPEVT